MKFHIAHLWIVSFLIVLPLLAQKWVFSPLFFATKNFKTKAPNLVDELNRQRYLQADSYFKNINVSSYNRMYERPILNADFAVIVITKKRFVCNRNEFDCEPHYLQQTLAALDSESRNSIDPIPSIVVCSVDPHWEWHLDLDAIRTFFPIIFRYNSTVADKPNNKEQETSDYAFCLEEAAFRFGTTKYLIVVEDDAVVFENFFPTINSVVKYRIERTIERGEPMINHNNLGWCWMKLYFPEWWSGFGWDANRLWELFWIGIAGGLIGSMLAFLVQTIQRSQVSSIWWACNGALYLLLVVFIISRPMWLEMRRIHVSLMQVTADSGCCSTVAVLYPMDEVKKIVDYLRSSKCHRCAYGVDLAIRDYKDRSEMVGLLVQPNLAQHIGLHSTVSSAYKDPIHFLFYDFLPF